MTVQAIGARRNNAELVVDLAALGYITGAVLDTTYGRGRFWKLHRPTNLVAVDLNPARAPIVADFRQLPFPDRSFDTVVLDPPYKLNGTSTGEGPSASDADYDVDEYRTIAERHQLIRDGITETGRVTRRWLIVKCQDQVCSGAVQWQTRIFADHAEQTCPICLRPHLRLVDTLHVRGARKQPPRTRRHAACRGAGCDSCTAGRIPSAQQHASRDYSTALVFERTRRRCQPILI